MTIKKNDLVFVEPYGWARSPSQTPSLAIVLDTKAKPSYVIYVAGRGSEVKHEPFWIDSEILKPYGDSSNEARDTKRGPKDGELS